MIERVKLIWDFRGPNAKPIAKHHVKHLEEFSISENLQHTICNIQEINSMHYIAYLVVEKTQMNALREILKPNRGQLFTEK
jgi:hypothetical protein